jgi:hypothetical protein
LRHDEAITRTGGVIQIATNSYGVITGISLMSAGAAACAPSVGVSCLLVPAGLGLAGASASGVYNGSKQFIYYDSNEANRVIASFNPVNYPGEHDRISEVATDALMQAAVFGFFKVADKVTTLIKPIADLKNRIFNGVSLDARLPDPASGYGYSPKFLTGVRTDNQFYSHWVGYQSELILANDVAKVTDQAVVKYGDAIGKNGADLVSVNVKTGEVTLWDAKYRSNPANVGESPTFTNYTQTTRQDAIDSIMNSNLDISIKQKAVLNLSTDNFKAITAGQGQVKQTIISVFKNGVKQ